MQDTGKCIVCKEASTSISCDIGEELTVFVCESCLEGAKDDFVFICMSCGEVFKRPKHSMVSKTRNKDLKRAYMLCEDMQLVQGIDMCIICSPKEIVDFYFESSTTGHNA